MRIYLDLDSRLILSAPNRSIRSLEFKRRDNESLELQFVRNGAVVQVSSGTVVKYGLKPVDQYAAGFFAAGSFSKTGTGESAVFTANLNLNTQPIAQAFYLEQKNISAMLEIETRDDDMVMSSVTLQVTIENDVLRGDEAPPAVMPDGKATQAEAQAGLDNEKWMTPLRTKQAISALSAGGSAGTSISNISGLQAALDAKQSAGTYAPAANISPSAITGTAVITTDSRLSNSRTPTAHKSSHATGGSDALTPADIGAATSAQGTKADSALQPSALTPYRTSAAQDLIDADKANISHTHSYNDLTNKPTLGTAAATASTSYATAAQGNKADSALQSGTAISNISGLQTALNGKQAAGSYAPSTNISPSAITGTAVIDSDIRLSDARVPGGIFWVNLGGVYIPQYGYLNGKPRYYLQSLRDDGWTDIYDVSFQNPSINKWMAEWSRVDDEGNGRSSLWVVSTSTNLTDYPWQATWVGVQPSNASSNAAVLAKATAIPAPPASGTYVFRAVNGVMSWVTA